jgi:hypothetical protein
MRKFPPLKLGLTAIKLSLTAIICIFVCEQEVYATEYECRNNEFEISCAKGKCEKSDGFTPMGISINTTNKNMSVCAYSSCFEGKADQLIEDSNFVVARGTKLKGQTPGAGYGDAVLVIDRENSGGSITAFGYDNPLTCTSN